jgi:hypothetical protein
VVVRTKNGMQMYLGRFPAPIVVTTDQGRGAGIGGEQWANIYLRCDLEAIKSYAAGAILSRGKQVQWAKGAIILFADRELAEPRTFG